MATRRAGLNVAASLPLGITLRVPEFGPTRRSSTTFHLPTKPFPSPRLQRDKPNPGGTPNSEQWSSGISQVYEAFLRISPKRMGVVRKILHDWPGNRPSATTTLVTHVALSATTTWEVKKP